MRSRTCTSTAALTLVAALALQLAAPAAAACQASTGGACTPSASSPQGDCCAGKTCHPVLKQCYPLPRTVGQPCLGERTAASGAGPVWYAVRLLPCPHSCSHVAVHNRAASTCLDSLLPCSPALPPPSSTPVACWPHATRPCPPLLMQTRMATPAAPTCPATPCGSAACRAPARWGDLCVCL